MRWLANYLRQVFCKHDWHIEEIDCEYRNEWGGYKEGEKVYMRCKKCGYNQNHWKG